MFDCEPMRRSKLPEAYLDLRIGADTRAHRERRVRGFVGGPFKLYRVQGTDEKLVAVVGPRFRDGSVPTSDLLRYRHTEWASILCTLAE